MIKAIETEYNGYRFRSRLEARWAVFFDVLKIEYQYEPEGFQLDKETRYLPDFWLPAQDCWLEIKALYPAGREVKRAKLLSLKSEKRVFIVVGSPWKDCEILVYLYGIHQHISPVNLWSWYICPNCDAPGLADTLLFMADPDLQTGLDSPGCKCRPDRLDIRNERLMGAYVAARQARFEKNGRTNQQPQIHQNSQ